MVASGPADFIRLPAAHTVMKVLLGVGGGDDSDIALDRTLERAAEADDDLTIGVFASNNTTIDEVEQTVKDRLATANVDADIRRIEEQPASRLVELAETEAFDQLVIGGGQRSPMGKISLGAITEFVLLNAQVTVRLER